MIGIKEFWVQDLPTLSNYATLDCMDSFCPRIKSNPVEKNCGQHTNLSFKEWLMYLTNSLFITEIKDKNSSKCEWISFRFFNIFLHFSVLVSHNTTVWCHFWKYQKKKKSSIWRMQKCQQTFTTFTNNFRF